MDSVSVSLIMILTWRGAEGGMRGIDFAFKRGPRNAWSDGMPLPDMTVAGYLQTVPHYWCRGLKDLWKWAMSWQAWFQGNPGCWPPDGNCFPKWLAACIWFARVDLSRLRLLPCVLHFNKDFRSLLCGLFGIYCIWQLTAGSVPILLIPSQSKAQNSAVLKRAWLILELNHVQLITLGTKAVDLQKQQLSSSCEL